MNWLPIAQAALRAQGLAAWWIYDFRGNNPVAARFIDMPEAHFSRRVVLMVPADGTPTLLAHAIEKGAAERGPWPVRTYADRHALRAALAEANPGGPVALEYAPEADLPYVSHVDAGTIELLRALGVDVRSSAEVLQAFATWTPAQVAAHERAAEAVMAVCHGAFDEIRRRLAGGETVREHEVQSWIAARFAERGLVTGHDAIVGFGPSAGDPHYAPRAGDDRALRDGDVVLIDLWAKEDRADAPFADVTWMGVRGSPSPEIARAWAAVRDGRDLAVRLIAERAAAGDPPAGWEVDRAVRDHLTAAGYGDAFVHRTGHSLGCGPIHGEAAHLDDFETRDVRRLTPGFGVTVEPGVYLPAFGIRSELDVLLEAGGPRVTTGVQAELEPV
ncbi:MAG: Xaa-Pro peptidase family protein [Trueperaceae bacterium]